MTASELIHFIKNKSEKESFHEIFKFIFSNINTKKYDNINDIFKSDLTGIELIFLISILNITFKYKDKLDDKAFTKFFCFVEKKAMKELSKEQFLFIFTRFSAYVVKK